MKKIVGWFTAGFILAAMFGCAPKPTIYPESATDTPENACRLGNENLEKGMYEDALKNFERAVGLDPQYEPGYVGLCLANTGLGDFKLAKKNIKQAINLKPEDPLAYVAYGRLYLAQGEYSGALDKFDVAIDIDAMCAPAHYWKGQTYEKMGIKEKAEKCYKDALTADPLYSKANLAWEKMQKVERAAAGLPEEYAEIAESNSVSRADMSALLINELKVEKYIKPVVEQKAPEFEAPPTLMGKQEKELEEAHQANDIAGSWAEGFIQKAIDIGIMELYPDGNFKPSAKINKAEFAMLCEKIIEKVTNDDMLATKFVGSTSPFPDVASSHPAFNSIMTVTTRGILKAKMDGNFGMSDPVSGADALLSIKALGSALEGK